MKNFLLTLAILFGGCIALQAQTWNGTVSNVWTNPLNWTPNVVPIASSSVLIPASPNTPKLPANTTLAALSTAAGAALDFNGFSLSVGNLNAYNTLTGTTFLNTNALTDIVFNITTPSGGYNFQINGCTFSDHMTMNLSGSDIFLEANTAPNTYNGNVTFNVNSSVTTNFCIAGPSQFNGNLSLVRSVGGSTSLFIAGGSITGNFNYQNLLGGHTGFGNGSTTTTINGTCTINATYPSPANFGMHRIKNLTSGGSIQVLNCLAPFIQQDTLKVTSLSIQGFEGNSYATFYNNKIEGNITLEDDVAYGGGYNIEFKNNLFIGNTVFTLKGTNHIYESNAANTGSVYQGNTTFNLAGTASLYFSNGDTSIFNGNLTINRTVGGYCAAFGSGAVINGNLTYNNTASGHNDLGNLAVKTSISGTLNVNVNLSAVNRFIMHRFTNQTPGGKINVRNSSGFNLQQDSLKVDSLNVLWYRGNDYADFQNNQIAGHVTLADSTNYNGGYATYIRNSTITGNTNFKIYGTNQFFEAHTSANTYNGNLLIEIPGSAPVYTSYSAKSTISGNYTVNRTGAGGTNLLGNAASIGGNFSCTKNVNGGIGIGTTSAKTTIGGTVNVSITQSLGDDFYLLRVQNSVNGGSIIVNTTKAPNIQQDTLLLNNFQVNGYGGSEYCYFFNNQITGNVTLSDVASYSGGYNTQIRNSTITGNTIFNINGTNHFYEAHTAAITYNGNLTMNIAGSGNVHTSYSAKSTINGNFTVNRTAVGYTALFSNAASISGNFSLTKNVPGSVDIGVISSKTSIGGTINLAITQDISSGFTMHRVQNLTNGGSISITNTRAFDIQQDSLLVSTFNIANYGGGAFAYLYNNQINGHVTITTDPSYGGGYASYIRNNTITGNTIFNLNGSNNFYEAHTLGNTYNGNLTFNADGTGGLFTSYSLKSTITGNYTVNRTVAGLLDLLGTGVTIGGNFSCTKNVGGSTLIGILTIPSTINGTITVNVTQNSGDDFRMYRVKNLSSGGSVTVNNCRAPSIQQDSLVLNSFSISNYHSGAFAYFYDNQIQGDFSTNPDPAFGGGYVSYFRSNTIFGNASISNPSTGVFNDADASGSGNTFLGNVTYSRTGSSALNVGSGDTNFYAGNVVFNNTAALPITAELMRFNGSTNTSIDQTSTGPIIIQKPIIAKTSGATVTLNKPVTASVSCTFVTGYLNSSTSNPLIFPNNVNHNGASNTSHVVGSVIKAGNDVFSFPLGNGIGYHPIAISAPATTADTFQANIILKHPSADGYDVTLKDAALVQIAPYHYWTLNQISGTNSENVSLGWSIPCANTVITSLPGLAVARWNGSQWNNLGYSASTGSPALGTVSMSGNTANYGVFALATTTPSNYWEITTVTASANTVCAGTSTTLTASGASTYSWQPGNLSGAVQVLTPLSTTTYTITGTSATGCITTATKTITVNPVPTANAGADKTNTCTTPTNTIGTAAVGGVTYAWLPATGLSASNIVQPTANPASTTTYTVTATITATGCTASDVVIVTVNKTPPTANAGADKTNTCTTPTNTIGTAAVGGVTYAWTPATGLSSTTIAQPTANPASTTTYTVTATNTANGCTATDAVIVTVNKTPPTANAGVDKTNTCTTPTNTIGTAAVGGVTYAWAPATGLSSTTIAQPTANPASTTTYTVTATNTANGCTATDAVIVTVNKTPPTANAGADKTNTCTTPTNTIGTAAVGGVTYAWAPATGLSSTTIAQPTANPASTTTYTVTATNSTNGCTATDAVIVTVNKTAPTISTSATATTICNGQSTTITATGGNSYTWQPGSLTGSSVTVSPTSTTTYTVTGTTTANGCSATSTRTITVNNCATALTVKAFLQGYYAGSGLMQPVLINQGVTPSVPNQCDNVTLELHNATAPYGLASTVIRPILTDGTVTANYFNLIGQSYYLVLKHRNGLETWSANPVTMTNTLSYDFTTASNKAYGNNMILVDLGKYAFFNGDVNQDGVIDGLDYNAWETDNNNFASGFFATDFTGDGIVDGLDFLIWEGNNTNFVGLITP